jgi:hypothetical protein
LDADETKLKVWGGVDETMWVNNNPDSHCPVQGFSEGDRDE